MDELFKLFSSPAFWFGSVLVAIVVNVATHYGIRYFEGAMSMLSKSWAERTQRRIEARNSKISQIKADKHMQLVCLLREMRHRSRAMRHLLFAFLFISLGLAEWIRLGSGAPVPLTFLLYSIASGVSAMMAIAEYWEAAELGRMTEEAMGENYPEE